MSSKLQEQPDSPLSIICYNVRRCFSTDGHYRPDLIAAVLSEIHPDIAVLFHIDPVLWTEEHLPQTEYFAQHLHLHVIASKCFATERGTMQSVVLSRYPLRLTREEDEEMATSLHGNVNVADGIALDTEIHVNGHIVRLIALQIAKITEAQLTHWISSLESNRADQRLIIACDFTDSKRSQHIIRKLDSHFNRSAVYATFPSFIPLFAQQRLWTREPLSLVNCHTHATPVSRNASNCLPLCGEILLSQTAKPHSNSPKHHLTANNSHYGMSS